MDEDNGAFLTIFLINCQSNCSANDTNIIWCSIPYQRSHRCSFPLWLNLRPVLPSYYHHHHSDMKGEKQVLHHCQGETLISEHLHSPPSSAGCMNALPRCSLIGWHWKAGILLMLKAGRLSPSPSTRCHTQLVALGGSPLCWLLLSRRHLQWDLAVREIGHSKSLKRYIIHLFIHVDSLKNLLGFCELNVLLFHHERH